MTEKYLIPKCTGPLKKSDIKNYDLNIVDAEWLNKRIEELRRLGYSDEYINQELGHLVNWRI